MRGEAAGAAGVWAVSSAGLSYRERERRECQQSGDGGAAQGCRHALGAAACEPAGGPAHHCLQ